MTCPVVELGGLLMDGATVDGDGILWTPTRIDGWFDSTAVSSGTQPQQPTGDYVTAAREQARAISLEVTATSEFPFSEPLGDDVYTAMETMKAAARAVFTPALLQITDPVHALQTYVRRVGPIKAAINGAKVDVHFVVPLLAPDPRRYRQTTDTDLVTLGSTVGTSTHTVTTAGDTDTPFVWTVKGPTTNPKVLSHALTNSPFLEWVGSLANSADVLVIDTGAGTVLHNGVDSSANLFAGSQMFDLVPAGNSLTFSRSVTTGSSDNSVARSDAFD